MLATLLTASLAFMPVQTGCGSETCALAAAASADTVTETTPVEAEETWTVQRVGGNKDIQTDQSDGTYRFDRMMVEASLPQAYPAPTPPGAIELKKYPQARRADVTSTGNPDRGRNTAFWPLFQHIKKRDIAMTSPVEMTYHTDTQDGLKLDWTMSFLYRTPDMGELETDGVVEVVDVEPMTVVSVGMRGEYVMRQTAAGLKVLNAWIKTQSEWERAGEPRVLYYNGPSIRDADKWSEVQLPVRRASSGTAVAAAE
jgi:hypothetical protein